MRRRVVTTVVRSLKKVDPMLSYIKMSDWTTESSIWEYQLIKHLWDFNQLLVNFSENTYTLKISLKSTHPNLLVVLQRVVLMYSDSHISIRRHVWHNLHNSTSKWFYAVIWRECSRSVQFSVLRTPTQTVTCASSQVSILKWPLNTITSKFSISCQACSFTSSTTLSQDLEKNSKLLEINITSSHSSAKTWDYTLRKVLSC